MDFPHVPHCYSNIVPKGTSYIGPAAVWLKETPTVSTREIKRAVVWTIAKMGYHYTL